MLRHRSASAKVPTPIATRFPRWTKSGPARTGQGTRLGGTADTPSMSRPRAQSAAKTKTTPEPAGCGSAVRRVPGTAGSAVPASVSTGFERDVPWTRFVFTRAPVGRAFCLDD
jgi:hypothetical protein